MRSVLLAALIAAPAAAQMPEPPQPADYTLDSNWLCLPGRPDACGGDISYSSIAASGKVTVNTPPPPPALPIDCFYLYPTVSTDQGGNSDLIAEDAENNVAKVQLAPFRPVCNTFAPMYRQVTLKALADAAAGKENPGDRILAYRDVMAAWYNYMNTKNGGRGVVLIGHSQGAGVLKTLIQNEIEGSNMAPKIVAAYLAGTNVLVPAGKAVGGDFQSTPLCSSASQVGCVVAWVSFRDTAPPPADSRFGLSKTPGQQVACANPASLAGGWAPLTPLIPTASGIAPANAVPQPAWVPGTNITTPFVTAPGMLSGQCLYDGNASYLAIRTNPNPSPKDKRVGTIGGDITVNGKIDPRSGLHLLDISVVQGNMIELIAAQSQAWLQAQQAQAAQ
jgi:hypothetical protein